MFEDKLAEAEKLYNEYLKAVDEKDGALSAFKTEYVSLVSETIDGDITSKVETVFRVAKEAADKILTLERVLARDEFARALEAAKPKYTQSEFIQELHNNYRDMGGYVEKYVDKGADSPSSVIKGLAQCYKNICDIRGSLPSLLKTYVKEIEIKENAIRQFSENRDKHVAKLDKVVDATRSKAHDYIVEVNSEIKEYHQGLFEITDIPATPIVKNTFDERVEIILGCSESSSSSVKEFSQLGQRIELPKTTAASVVLGDENRNPNILLKYKNSDSESEGLYAVIESLFMRFVQSYPAYFKQICAVHPKTGSKLISVLCNYNDRLLFGKNDVATSSNAIRDTVLELGKVLNERMRIIGKSNIIDYNAKNPNNAKPIIMVLLKDYPNGYDESIRKEFVQIMENANRCGIYLVAVAEDSVSDGLTQFCGRVYDYKDKKLTTYNSYIDCLRGHEHLTNEYYQLLGDKLDAMLKAGSIITFDDINPKEQSKEPYYAVTEIPVGKDEAGNKFALKLDSRGINAHAVIAGMSGSGKSSLLQNIVLGGARNYSPEELNYWLMDFKDGAGFGIYKNLKHVKMMALKNKKKDAGEILKYLADEMSARYDRIREAGCNDIVDYNKKQSKNNGKLMPRLVVVIDEYAQMASMRECVNMFNRQITPLARAAGISLIMCSQLYDTSFADSVSQMDNKFSFSYQDGGLIRSEYKDTQDEAYLNSLKGNCLCLISGKKIRIRCAYAGDSTAQMKRIEQINDLYPTIPYESPVIIDKPEPKTKNPSELKIDSDKVRNSYYNSDNGRHLLTEIGQTRLGSAIRYKIDDENPLLFIFGDETRATSIEYSLLKNFTQLADGKPNVYYMDLYRAADRKNNIMRKWTESGDPNVNFVKKTDVQSEILNLYKIYQSRYDLLDNDEDVGSPVEIVIHSAEELLDRLTKTAKKGTGTAAGSREARANAAAQDLDLSDPDALERFISGGAPVIDDEEESSVTPLDAFEELFRDGKKCRIYMILHFTDITAFEKSKHKLFDGDPNMKDAIIVPKRPALDDALSYSAIIDYLKAAGQSEYAMLYSDGVDGGTEIGEFEYAVMIDEGQPMKFLPYEWETK